MKKCKNIGIKVHTWTVDSFEDFLWCRDNDVDVVITINLGLYRDKARD